MVFLSDLCGLSERSERARERHSIICGQEFVASSKLQRALSNRGKRRIARKYSECVIDRDLGKGATGYHRGTPQVRRKDDPFV
jgi:hypothetical protein